MSELLIRIKLDNAAFQDGNKEYEIKRILNVVRDNIDQIIGYDKYILNLRDFNGNKTGFVRINKTLTIEDITDMIEKRIKNAKEDITRSEQDNLIVLLTYLRTYEMVI